MNKSSPKTSLSDEDYRLWVLLQQAHYAVSRLREKELDQFGVSITQAKVMAVIRALDTPATPAEIARRVLRAPHTISEMINRIASQGLVKKIKDLDRKNMVRIELTDEGEQVFQRFTMMKHISAVLAQLPDTDRKNLDTCLTRLRDLAMEENKK